MCYDCSNRTSFTNIASVWIPRLKNNDGITPYLLVGTKADIFDRERSDHVSQSEAHKFATSHGAYTSLRCSSNIYVSSNYLKGNVDDVFNASIKFALVTKGIVKERKCCALL